MIQLIFFHPQSQKYVARSCFVDFSFDRSKYQGNQLANARLDRLGWNRNWFLVGIGDALEDRCGPKDSGHQYGH